MKRKSFFSLTELLVVVSLLAILLSLLSPALRKALMHSQNILCANNLKQVGQTIFTYATDENDKLPAYCADIWRSRTINSGNRRLDEMWKKFTGYGLTGQMVQCPWTNYYGSWKKYWMKTYSSRSSYFYTLAAGSYYNTSTYKEKTLNDSNAKTSTLVIDTATDPWDVNTYPNNHSDSNGKLLSQNGICLDGHLYTLEFPAYSKRFGL